MPLDFAEFAHHYDGSAISDVEKREHFEAFASIMECLVRLYWQDDTAPNALGISLDSDTFSLFKTLESENPLPTTFNSAASEPAAGKTQS